MATSRAQDIINKVIDDLSSYDSVAALVLAGSQVEGNAFPADEYSDIEFYVVTFDDKFEETEDLVQNIQERLGEAYIFAYKNQWAGWSILLDDLLRLELPLVKASDDQVFSRSEKQKIKILYQKDDFNLKQSKDKKQDKAEPDYQWIIKDFWYMTVYTAQHIGRGELWLARDAMRVSMQNKIKKILQVQNHKETLELDRDRRIELTWSDKELQILREISCSYDRDDIIRAFWENIKYAKLFVSNNSQLADLFGQYENKLITEINMILDGKS